MNDRKNKDDLRVPSCCFDEKNVSLRDLYSHVISSNFKKLRPFLF